MTDDNSGYMILKAQAEAIGSSGGVCAQLTPWTAAHQAPLSMGISRLEHWSGLPFPSPGNVPDPGIELASSVLHLLHWQADPSPLSHLGDIKESRMADTVGEHIHTEKKG